MDAMIHEVVVDELYVTWVCEECDEVNEDALMPGFSETVECSDEDCEETYELIPHTDNVHIEVV